jgi:hypothetical protein
MPVSINEEMLQEQMETKADRYLQKYENVFAATALSPNFAGKRKFSKYDAFQLGEQIEKYKQYEAFVVNEAGASATDLGTLPTLAVDLVAAVYGTSIAPLLASLQNIEDQQGLVYFKQVVVGTTLAGRTAGDVFANATQGIVNDLSAYAGERVTAELLGTGNGSLTSFTGTTARFPIRSTFQATVQTTGRAGADVTATLDPATGNLLSAGAIISGNVNFTTGAYTITFSTALTNAATVTINYFVDFEQATDIPDVNLSLTTLSVNAEIIALKQPITSFKTFAFNKRFGKLADEEALADLTGALADIDSRKTIAALIAAPNQPSALTFDATVPSGVSKFEARQGFRYTLLAADAAINQAAGRGVANRHVGGYNYCQYVAALPGFTLAPNNQAVGPHVYGYLDGIPVIRTKYITETTTTGVGYVSYLNPSSPFESPVVVSTYMPLFITSTIQNGANPFRSQRAAAMWKSYNGVVGQFVIKINITNIPTT